jgi:hypothetical protein
MAKQSSNHGITLDEKAQEQPTDKDRAQKDRDQSWSAAANEKGRH